jgi:hypothetical protein
VPTNLAGLQGPRTSQQTIPPGLRLLPRDLSAAPCLFRRPRHCFLFGLGPFWQRHPLRADFVSTATPVVLRTGSPRSVSEGIPRATVHGVDVVIAASNDNRGHCSPPTPNPPGPLLAGRTRRPKCHACTHPAVEPGGVPQCSLPCQGVTAACFLGRRRRHVSQLIARRRHDGGHGQGPAWAYHSTRINTSDVVRLVSLPRPPKASQTTTTRTVGPKESSRV